FGKGFGTAMNAGWYNTAKPHQLFGFDVTINATLAMVPTQDESFDLDNYTWNFLLPGLDSESPTIAGSGDGASVGLDMGNGNTISNLYDLPSGTGFAMVPLPMMQVGVGVFKGTDLSFRFFPEVGLGDFGKVGMFGFGLRHDFKQWIPGFKKLPFDMSAQFGWSRLSGIYNKVEYYPTDYIDVPFEVIDPQLPTTEEGIANDYYRTQDLTLTSSAWNTNLIISKKIAVLTGYVSIGYAASNFNISLNGNYLLPDYIPASDPDYNASDDTNGDYIVTVLDQSNEMRDPIDANIEYSSINTSVGLRLKLALLTLHAAYVYQDYSMYNVGLGVSFR
ncbi:MAG TPA: DUF6588 family protein, partial [Salinivirga sp.]|uniref:DUF6588 family protein n=1 Tax=Salinivirga sp. TaxID=1970192 RepID=UPI002B46AF5B